MSIQSIVSQLKALGIELFASGNHIRIKAPPGAMNNTLRVLIKQHKTQILDFLEAQPVELSAAQQRLWLRHQYSDAPTEYNIPLVLRCRRNIDAERLAVALNKILKRHQSLRTRFVEADGIVMQSPLQDVTIDLERTYVRSMNQQQLNDFVVQFAELPFCLGQEPTMRAHLLEYEDQSASLVLVFHHISVDGWSMKILVDELSHFYQNQDTPLAPLQWQYRDYAVSQKSDDQTAVLKWWVEQLDGAPQLHSLVTDKARPKVLSTAAGVLLRDIAPTIGDTLKQWCKAHSCTPFHALHSLFALLIAIQSHENDVVIGTAVANRNLEQTQPMIGFFVNNLALRTQVDSSKTFSQWALICKKIDLAAVARQQVPFDEVVKNVQRTRSLDSHPVFQLLFNYQQTDLLEANERVLFKVEEVTVPVAHFDLALNITDTPGGLKLYWEYSTDLFEQHGIEQLAHTFEAMLQAVLAQPDIPLAQLNFTTAQQRQWLMAANQQGLTDLPKKCAFRLFEQQSAQNPEQLAILCADHTLCYRQVNQQANQMARLLIKLGLKQEQVVGILLGRMPEVFIAMLAIHKAGAAYLPLDPAYPKDRLEYMLAETQCDFIISQQALFDAYNLTPKNSLCLDDSETQALLAAQLNDNISEQLVAPQFNSLAYCVFTSGSTGNPKGVLIEHRGLTNIALMLNRGHGVDNNSKVLQHASLSFDPTTWDWLMALTNGATLCLVSDECIKDTEMLSEQMISMGITHATLPPAVASCMTPERFTALEYVYLIGEHFTMELADRWSVGRALYNGYGPTEVTIGATLYRYDSKRGILPIGRPFPNVSLFITNEQGRLLPPGAIGEICIGGIGVARGYLNRPEQTAEKFVHSIDCNDRVYKTGDLGYYMADGNVVFKGRIDKQVKINSQRIELGEIETRLRAHPEVAQALVGVSRYKGNQYIVGYYIAKRDKVEHSALSRYLSEFLPAHMIPAAYLAIDAIPLTTNGKVDEKKLPQLDWQQHQAAQFVEPKGEIQMFLAQLWQRLLAVETVGANDAFFALGGHSLTANRMLVAINKRFAVKLPLRSIFATPVLVDFAKQIEQQRIAEKDTRRTLPSLQRLNLSVAPVSFAQQRLWLTEQVAEHPGLYNIPLTLQLTGDLDIAALEYALQQIVQRHQVLRTGIREQEGQLQQHLVEVEGELLAVIDLSHLQGQTQQEALLQTVAAQSKQSFSLDAGIMLRAALVKLAAQDAVLAINLHHIAADGWSLSLLCHECMAFYRHHLNGGTYPLPPLEVQYSDYAVWQRQWLDSAVLVSQLAFWSDRLQGVSRLHNLPLSAARPPEQDFSGAHLLQRIDPQLTELLNALAKQQDVTLFMLLYGAFNLLLNRYSGDKQTAVGTPVANRDDPALEELLGFFVNTLVLTASVEGEKPFVHYLQQVKSHVLAALEHQQVPFDLVVESVQPQRTVSHHPLFQVMFALQNNESHALTLVGVECQELDIDESLSRFDLNVTVNTDEQGMLIDWCYATALFDREFIELMTGAYLALLAQLVDKPSLPLCEYTLAQQSIAPDDVSLVGAEQTNVVPLWQRLEQNLVRCPQAPALQCDGQTLSYSELFDQVECLALALNQQGVKVGSRVGVLLEREPQMLIALLAIWHIGAIYVPLASNWPDARLTALIAKSQVQLVLSNELNRACLADVDNCIDPEPLRQNPNLLSAKQKLMFHRPLADETAYLMFTSGSSGEPKGVAVSHHALDQFLNGMLQRLSMSPGDRWLAVTTTTFDISLLELLAPLCCGGQVVIATQQQVDEPKSLALLLQQNIHWMQSTPSRWQQLLNIGWRGNNQLNLLCGGEALPQDLAQVLVDSCGRLFNCYGPTEATIWSMVRRIDHDQGKPCISCLGGPLANYRHYILDDHQRPVAPGAAGELYIAGPALAQGYWRVQALTAAAFIEVDGQRMYRSGDMVRQVGNGLIQFLGRQDGQVKLHGYRIELAEVESRLRLVPWVRNAAVAVHGEGQNQQLVGYVVCDGNVPDSVILSLNETLREQLPPYMVPNRLRSVNELPLNANGKLDRNGLTSDLGKAVTVAHTEATSELEKALSDIWQDILALDSVGINADFFSLGGNSLLATRLSAQVSERLALPCSVALVFKHNTVKRMALALEKAKKNRLNAIVRRPEGVNSELSFAQQGVWLSAQIVESDAYHLSGSYYLDGNLNVEALQFALDSVVARHEALRTVYIWKADEQQVEQQVQVAKPVVFPFIDLQALADDAQGQAIEVLAQQVNHQAFDLSRDWPIRAGLAKLGKDCYRFFLTVHHISGDATSLDILQQELAYFYLARQTGNVAPLPPLSLQYADFAWHQRQPQAIEVQQAALAYWSDQLVELPPVHQLPLDRPRPVVPTIEGALYYQQLSQPLSKALQAQAKQQQCSLFSLLYAGLSLWLSRISDEHDVVLGTPVSMRSTPELENIIGCFVNTVVLRQQVELNSDFATHLQASKTIVADALENQSISFETLVEHLQPSRSSSYHPLFQLLFTLHQNEPGTVDWGDIHWRSDSQAAVAAKFDLSLDIVAAEAGFEMQWEYSTALFDAHTIEMFANSYVRLLEDILANEQATLAEFSLVGASSLERQYITYNDSKLDYPKVAGIHLLFEQMAHTQPEHQAVVYNDHGLSYAELNRQANRLARYLRSVGVGNEVRVAVCIERSERLLWCLLSILKASGAYVPLDPAYPKERLAFMLVDSGCQILLTDSDVVDNLELPQGCTSLLLDDTQAKIAHFDDHNLALDDDFTTSSLAYIIYTSGSTGQPKGVATEHQALIETYFAYLHDYQLQTSATNCLQMASVSFDVFTGDWVRALCSGGRLVMCSRDTLLEPALLYQLMCRQSVTFAEFVPAILRQLAAYLQLNGQDLSFMKLLVVSSDSWYGEDHELVKGLCGQNTRFLNTYGVTEASIDSCYYEIKGDGYYQGIQVPVGKPLANSRLYIFDRNQRPLPEGVAGELCIGGGLAREYWQNPDKTQEVFCKNGYVKERIYRTGDRARLLPSGDVLLLGRMDRQVKVRGFRIELGEIEAVLSAHPSVASVAVLLKQQSGQEPTLVACVATGVTPAHTEQGALAAELKAYVLTHLPRFMCPASFIILAKMPLTPNGKLDRKVLQQLQPVTLGKAVAQSDLNSTQQLLCEIWCRLLGLDEVSLEDNFFALGGDSILAIQVASDALRQGVRITTRDIFASQTLAQLAEIGDIAVVEALGMKASNGRLQLLPVQQEFLARNVVNPNHYNQSLLLSVPLPINLAQLRSVARALVEKHDVLRLRFDISSGKPSAYYLENDNQLIEQMLSHAAIDHADDAQLQQAIYRQSDIAQQSLSLTDGPLCQITLIQSEQQNWLFICAHHLVIDGVSWRILLTDLQQIWQLLNSGHPPVLARMSSSYQAWGEFLHQRIAQGHYDGELDYWLEQGAQCSAMLPDNAHLLGDYNSGAEQQLTFDESLTDALLHCHEAYNTKVDEILISALVLAVHRWSDATAVQIALEHHGRVDLADTINIEHTLGWFTSIYPVRFDAAEAEQLNLLVVHVKERLRQVPNQGIGYGLLRHIGQQQQLTAQTTPEICFNYLGKLDEQTSGEFAACPWCTAPDIARDNTREYALEVNCFIANGQFKLNIEYCGEQLQSQAMKSFVESYGAALRDVISHCQDPQAGAMTPSDFTEQKIAADELADLLDFFEE